VLDTVSPANRSPNWSLDALGNWSSLSTDGTAQSRTHNSQNQITSIQTQTTPTYDNNGDTTTGNASQQYTFDAWNHIHAVKNAGGTALVTHSYDAAYRRIQEAPASGATSDLYYSASWQVLEERLSTHPSAPSTQMIWSPVYIDCMVLRDRDTNADGTMDERLYCLQDANYNVTSTLSTAGGIAERYRCDPYGAVTYLDSSFNSHASAYAWQYLHQGGRLDLVSGLYSFRNRDLHPTLGRWMQEDPLGYVDGRSLVQLLGSSPIGVVDPSGLVVAWPIGPGRYYAPSPFLGTAPWRNGEIRDRWVV
jgi:RHS repeat-associated protein